jgi:hypothetical protein
MGDGKNKNPLVHECILSPDGKIISYEIKCDPPCIIHEDTFLNVFQLGKFKSYQTIIVVVKRDFKSLIDKTINFQHTLVNNVIFRFMLEHVFKTMFEKIESCSDDTIITINISDGVN